MKKLRKLDLDCMEREFHVLKNPDSILGGYSYNEWSCVFNRTLFVISFTLFIMCFPGNLKAQNTKDEVIYIPDNRWKSTKKGEIEHYKNYSPDIIPDYFILGTLYHFVKNGDQFDLYQHYEEPLVDYLIEFAREKFDISLQKNEGERGSRGYDVYSPELSNRIKSYFDPGEKLKYVEELKYNIFNSNEEICSYLLGVYYRYGYKINDSIYKIQSPTYGDKVYTLLKEMDCGRIFYIKRKYVIPGGCMFYFEPSILLKKYLDTIEAEKTKLYKSYLERNNSKTKDKEIQNREIEKEKIESFFLDL